jgi:hypothetical protein
MLTANPDEIEIINLRNDLENLIKLTKGWYSLTIMTLLIIYNF